MVVSTAVGVTAGVFLGASQFLVAQLTEANTLCFSPVSDQIHERAGACEGSQAKARAFQSLNYFGRPIDRLIQAAVAPFFILKSYIGSIIAIKRQYKALEKSGDNKGLCEVLKDTYRIKAGMAVIGFPTMLIYGLMNSVGSILRAAGELIFPVMTVTFIVQGTEGAKMFGWAKQTIWDGPEDPRFLSMIFPRPQGNFKEVDLPKFIAPFIV